MRSSETDATGDAADFSSAREHARLATADTAVLFVVDSTFPGLGGAEIQAMKLAHALRERGVRVDFVTPRIHTDQRLQESVDGFSVNRISYPHIRVLGTIVLLLRFAWYLWQHRKHYHCVHVHVTRLLAAVAGVMRPFTGVRVVTKISGFFEFEGGVLDMRKRFAPINALLRFALRRVDHIQTISTETREKLLAAGFSDQQILFIPNGIDTRHVASSQPADDSFIIGYCGRLRAVKGVHVLIDGFAMACERLPTHDLQLHIAGDGEEYDALQSQVNELGLSQRVNFMGRIDDTARFLCNLHVYVQPSFAEGLPNSVIEAMMAARPVLVTDIGGNRDLVDAGVSGYVFAAGDHVALGTLLVDMVETPATKLAVLGQSGQHFIVENYGFDRVATQLVELYRGSPD